MKNILTNTIKENLKENDKVIKTFEYNNKNLIELF